MNLARSLVHLHSQDVSLITLPTTTDTYDYPTYDQHLMAVQPQDDVLYQMVRTGQVWNGHLPTQPYSKVRVRVVNGTGQTGLARRTAAKLRELGFDVISVGNAAAASTTTTVDYAGLDQADGAYTLMTALKSFPAGQNTLAEPAWQVGSPGPVTLILGSDFVGVKQAAPAAHAAPGGKSGGTKHRKNHRGATGGVTTLSTANQSGPGAVQSRNAGASICSGLPRSSRG
jgi:hypothetical protein